MSSSQFRLVSKNQSSSLQHFDSDFVYVSFSWRWCEKRKKKEFMQKMKKTKKNQQKETSVDVLRFLFVYGKPNFEGMRNLSMSVNPVCLFKSGPMLLRQIFTPITFQSTIINCSFQVFFYCIFGNKNFFTDIDEALKFFGKEVFLVYKINCFLLHEKTFLFFTKCLRIFCSVSYWWRFCYYTCLGDPENCFLLVFNKFKKKNIQIEFNWLLKFKFIMNLSNLNF